MKKIIVFFIIVFSIGDVSANSFYFGHCTWYVANIKDVSWRGNAKDWIENARDKGYKIKKRGDVGDIVVFFGKGYNSKYGHTGIVEIVRGEKMVISDMNYKGLNIITHRVISLYDSSIIGFIETGKKK